MNIRIHVVLGLSVAAWPAFAQPGPEALLPPVQVVPFVAECARPVLPSQRLVAEWTGLHNLNQVYVARERLMGRIARACRQPGVGRVQVVATPASQQGDAARVAAIGNAGR